MKKRIGQVFSLVLAVVLVISMAIPAHADVSDAAGYVVGEFWDMMTGKEYDTYFDYWKNFVGYLAGEECPSSPDKYHHGSVPVGGIGVFGSGGTDDNGKFVWHTCDYCGEQFKVYASDLQQSYGAQVGELPATGYNSDGSLLWSPKLFSFGVTCVRSGTTYWAGCPHFEITGYWTGRYVDGDVVTDCNANSIFVRPKSGTSSFPLSRVRYCFRDVYPIAGFYTLLETVGIEGYYITSSGRTPFIKSFNPSSSVYYDAESSYSLDFLFPDGDFSSNLGFIAFSAQGSSPVYKIVPYDSLVGEINTTYNINSRPTSITGDYGIIGDNGQIIKVEGDKIVNETNNTYYNPSTGETKTMSDWSYNYEDRSYTVTTESGDTVTITYGDENVTIKEGDITYNIYYLVDGSGSEGPGPDVPGTCNHQWAETSTTPATCTVPGSRTLTCSLCDEIKTETIPAPGHKWTVKQEVKNEYDESGNQTQEGYTIWECSVCGEQQKTTDGTAPPGGGSGTGSGSSGGVFSGIFGLLVDFLGFFWNTFRDFVGEGVKGFLNALMDGTSSIFGLLNPFNWGG